MQIRGNYINNRWVEPKIGRFIPVINPTNNKTIAKIMGSGVEDTRNAIEAARHSFYVTRDWRDMCPQNRAEIILKIADKIFLKRDEIAKIESMNNGKPLREAECDIDDAIQCFRYYAGIITKPLGESYKVNEGFGEMHSYTTYEPVGVCAQITPWNYPFLMAAWKIAPALAAGNSIVFKPSSTTPLSTVMLFEIFELLNLPRGTVNLLLGSGSIAGQEMAESKDVDMISFTGSTGVGQGIAKAAVGNLKRVGLELGGKSPNIIFADADIENAVEWAMIGIFFNQGEVCSAGSRIIVEKSIKDKFLKRFIERAKNIKVGDPLKNSEMGPLVSESHMNKVLNYIEIGKSEGAECVCGGERYVEGSCCDGFFVKPTIFDNCNREMKIVQEEIFGPVAVILTFETEEEAITIANDTCYGLAGAVFTSDGAKAIRVINEIRAGIMWINCYNPTYCEAPWGGYKMSGIGRELGIHGYQEYLEMKQVNINLSSQNLDWYDMSPANEIYTGEIKAKDQKII